MNLPIISTAAAFLGIMYVALSFNVASYRRRNKISLGTKDDSKLMRKIRMHGNFMEYTPIVLILALICEIQTINLWLLKIILVWFCLTRVSHTIAISSPKIPIGFRVLGMIGTFSSIIILSASLILNTAKVN